MSTDTLMRSSLMALPFRFALAWDAELEGTTEPNLAAAYTDLGDAPAVSRLVRRLVSSADDQAAEYGEAIPHPLEGVELVPMEGQGGVSCVMVRLGPERQPRMGVTADHVTFAWADLSDLSATQDGLRTWAAEVCEAVLTLRALRP